MPVNSRVGYALVGRNDIDSYEEAELKPKTRLQEELEQDRPQLVYVGRQHERSELVDVLMIREDVNEDHERTTSHMNSSWGDQLDHILSETEYEWHANLEPFDNMRSALECLVTEIALFHFRCEPPAEYMRVFHDFRAAAEVEDECGLLASVGGVAHEEIESEERKGKTAVFVAGWRSMEAHKDFKNTKTYREYMPKLLEGISG